MAKPRAYLTVNVYPFSTGWRVAVLLKEAGKPYPRLLRTISIVDLPPDTAGMVGALAASAEVLQRLSCDAEVAHLADRAPGEG